MWDIFTFLLFYVKSLHLPESSFMREKSLSVTFCSTSFSSLSSSPNHSSFRPRMLSMISLGEIPVNNAAKKGLPKIYESLKSDPNINCNDNKEEQPMAIGVTPAHANSWE